MFYNLTKAQAIIIASDYQYIKGRNIFIEGSEYPIEEISAIEMQDGSWNVILETYLGDKPVKDHSNLIAYFFTWATDNNLEFDPYKYNLDPPQDR